MKIEHRNYLKTSTPFNHAASIEFFNGNFVFAWFGGAGEGHADCRIFLNNLNGKNEIIQIGDRDLIPRWNPILFAHKDKLFLFEKSGMFCDRWTTFIHDITNWNEDIKNKEIYASAQMLPAGLNGPVKTRPLVNGNILTCGSSAETMYDWTSYMESYSIKDNFKFISRSNPIAIKDKKSYTDRHSGRTMHTKGIIQPAIWFDRETSSEMHALFRYQGHNPFIYYSRSSILSDSIWEDPIPTNIPNPNSGISVLKIGERVFLAYNPSNTDRFPLCIDEIKIEYIEFGKHIDFKRINTITISEKPDSSLRMNTGELSYPYMIENDGKIHLVYTVGRTLIEHVVVSI